MSATPHVRLLLGLMFVLGACGGKTDRDVSGPPPSEVGSAAESSPASAAAEILDAIVLAESDAPAGMVFDAEDLGETARDHLLSISPSEIHEAVERGWVDALLRQWWTPEFFEAINSGVEFPKKKFRQSGNWTFLSGASAYEDAASASAALEAYLEDYRVNWGLTETVKIEGPSESHVVEKAAFEADRLRRWFGRWPYSRRSCLFTSRRRRQHCKNPNAAGQAVRVSARGWGRVA